MFLLKNENLPITPNENKSFNTSFILNNDITLENNTTFIVNNFILENKIPVLDSSTGFYVVENITTDIDIFYTPEDVFTLAEDPEDIKDNEFVIVNTNLYIKSSKELATITILKQSNSIKSLQFNSLSSLLKGLPIEGGFNIVESFQDHPTANIVFITNQTFLPQFRIRFQNGSLIQLFKYGFVVNSYDEELIKDTNQVKVSLSLRGKWELFVNENISLNANISNSSTTVDPDCAIDSDNRNYISIQSLSKKIGANISGLSFNINKTFPIDLNESTTISTEVNKYLDINESFIDFNHNNSIRIIKTQSTRTWYVYGKDLLENFKTTINSLPYKPVANSQPIQTQAILYDSLVPDTIRENSLTNIVNENIATIPEIIVKNVVADNVFLENGKIEEDEKTNSNVPQFELRSTKTYSVDRGDLKANRHPESITTLTTLDFNFDKNGTTKTFILSKEEEDGSKIQEIIRTYGFAYRAFEVSSQIVLPGEDEQSYVIRGNPANFWGLIEEKVVNYNYDEETGYFLGTNTYGRRLLRYQTEENENYEEYIELENDPEIDNFDIAQRNSRIFQWVTLRGIKRFLIHQHRDYYREFDRPERFTKECLPDGTSRIIKDPTYVEPMFAKAMGEEIQCFSYRQNPENIGRESGDPIFPPLTRGQETYNRFFINILDSQNTKPGYVLDTNLPKEDRYVTYTSNYTAQEPGFSTIIENVTSSTSSGIPPIHIKKAPKYKLVEPDKEEEEKEKDYYRYIFYTNPFNGNYPRTETINFEKAKNINDVVNGYKNKLKIEDMRNTLSSTCKIPINLNMSAGDKINVMVGGIKYQRRLITINHQFILNGEDVNGVCNVIDGGSTLTMGIERNVDFQIKREKTEKTNNKNENNPQFIINENDLVLGSLLPKRTRTRGNYYTLENE